MLINPAEGSGGGEVWGRRSEAGGLGQGSGAGGPGQGVQGRQECGAGSPGPGGVGTQVAWNLFMPKVEHLLFNKLMC